MAGMSSWVRPRTGVPLTLRRRSPAWMPARRAGLWGSVSAIITPASKGKYTLRLKSRRGWS